MKSDFSRLASRRPRPIQPFQPTFMSEFEGRPVPERRWFIPGWVPMDRVSGLYGESTVGKTLLAQMLMTATALGRPWLGLNVRQGRTLGIFCEDDLAELHIRQAAINAHYGCDFGDFELNLNQVLDFAKEFGIESIIIDTEADVYGGNQNDSGQARLFVQQALGHMAREINGVVLLCAHPSRAGARSGAGDSGSVQWDATMRARLLLERPTVQNGDQPDPYARTLRLASSNYAPRDEQIELLWQDHVFVRKDRPTGIFAMIERRSCEAVFLALLDKLQGQGLRVSASISSPSYAPKVFARRSETERGGYKLKQFEHAMNALFDSGELHNEEYGKPSRQMSRIVRATLQNEAAE
jgi:RecA-family ATPase